MAEETLNDAEVTVLIPVRNGEDFVQEAMQSVLSQSIGGVRLVVSNNGSIDRTVDRIRALQHDPRVAYIDQAEATDAVGHFNKLLAGVSTKYFMLLCHDDYLCDPGALAEARDTLERHPEVAAVFCDLAYVDALGALIGLRRFGRAGLVDSARIARQSVLATRNLFGIPLLIRTAAAHGACYEKSLAYAADLDYAIAITRHRPVFHIARPLVANRYHGANMSVSVFRLALGQMKIIAARNAIPLGALDRAAMGVAALLVGLQKWLFFRYLKIRRPRPGARYAAPAAAP